MDFYLCKLLKNWIICCRLKSNQNLLPKYALALNGNICAFALIRHRIKRQRSHSQRKLNVYVDLCSPLTSFVPLRWLLIIASLGQVAHFTIVVIRYVLTTSGLVRFAHSAPYAKSKKKQLLLLDILHNLGRRFGDSCTCMITQQIIFC